MSGITSLLRRLPLALGLFLFSHADSAMAGNIWIDCTPSQASAYSVRAGVKCTTLFDDGDGNGVNTIQYFAVDTTDEQFSNRVSAMLLASVTSNKVVRVLYDPQDTSGSSYGCDPSNCRRLQAVNIVK